MAFSTSSTLLDSLVLAIVKKEDTYGYKITQEVKDAMEISESTLYPVLRRLQKNNCLETYDKEFMGRNRRYYRITNKGRETLELNKDEWVSYRKSIEKILFDKFDEGEK